MSRRAARKSNRLPVALLIAPADRRWWHAVLAGALLLGTIALAVYALHDIGSRPAVWSQHITGALFSLFLGLGLGGPFVIPRLSSWFFAVAGWTLPVALIWMGVEHWLDWIAFYETGRRHSVTTKTGARVQGAFVLAFGVAGLLMYLSSRRKAIARRRA